MVTSHGNRTDRRSDDQSWGEVCAAARHDGMSEERNHKQEAEPVTRQLSLFE